MTLVVGVDGWREGWVAVALRDGAFDRAVACPALSDVLGSFPGAEIVAVDIPIGLPSTGVRRADTAARAFVGPRRSSVFLAPPREALAAATHRAAVDACVACNAPRISRQAFALRAKILETEPVARTEPPVVEVHPEVSFRALARRDLSSKRSWNGQNERRMVLAGARIVVPDDRAAAGRAAADDVLDAAIAAWSAARAARACARTLPEQPARAEPRIWY